MPLMSRTSRPIDQPTGTHEESKAYYSGKHKLYGYKLEASVLADGIAIGCSNHFPGSISDINIFNQMAEFQCDALQKLEKERNITDIGELLIGILNTAQFRLTKANKVPKSLCV